MIQSAFTKQEHLCNTSMILCKIKSAFLMSSPRWRTSWHFYLSEVLSLDTYKTRVRPIDSNYSCSQVVFVITATPWRINMFFFPFFCLFWGNTNSPNCASSTLTSQIYQQLCDPHSGNKSIWLLLSMSLLPKIPLRLPSVAFIIASSMRQLRIKLPNGFFSSRMPWSTIVQLCWS